MKIWDSVYISVVVKYHFNNGHNGLVFKPWLKNRTKITQIIQKHPLSGNQKFWWSQFFYQFIQNQDNVLMFKISDD